MRVRVSLFFRSSFAAKRHGVLLGLSLLLLRPDAALSEIVFSGDRNIAIPTNFDGVYINIGNGQFGSSPVSGWDLNPFFGGLFIANSPNFQPARIGDDCEDAIIRLAPTSVIGGNLTYSSDWGGSGAEGGQGHLGSGPLQFADGKSGYFGFKLVSEEADPLYGWMQVVLTENGANGRIQSWAYETSGGSILVGVTGQSGQRVVSNVQAPVNASNAGDAILLGANGKITFEESGQQQGSFSGKIEGDGEIKVAGAGGLRLTGSNTFSGIASVLEGSKLTVTKNENIGSAEVKLGASAAWVFDSSAAYNGDVNTFANKITLDQGNATLSNTGDGVVEIAGAIDGEGSLVKDGAGDMKITGNNTYTGATTLVAGITLIGHASALGSGGNITFSGGELIYGTGITQDFSSRIKNSGSAVLVDTNGGSVTWATALGSTNTGGLTKDGAGTLALSGNNTYTGNTTITGGALNVASTGSLASGNALTVGASGTAAFANADQTLGAVSNANTATSALNFSASTGTVTLASLSGNGSTRFGSAGTVTGGISSGTVASVGALNANISGGSINAGVLLTGNISNGTVIAASLSSSSVTGGTNTIAGAANITTLNGGNTTVSGSATITTMSSGTANLNGASNSITTLNGGTVNLGSANLGVSGGSSSGSITGVGGLIKSGSGTLTLSGSNSYSGATLISGGKLKLTGAGSIGNTSQVSLGNATASGTFDVSDKAGGYTIGTLIGSGMVTGNLSVSTQLAIGNSPGTTTFNGNLTLGAGSTYNYELTGGASPGLADVGLVAGDLTITAGSILDLEQLGTYTDGNKFTLFAYNGNLSGTFKDTLGNTLSEGSTFTDAGGVWTIYYADSTAGANGGQAEGYNYVTIAAIPESSVLTLLGSLGALALLRRKR